MGCDIHAFVEIKIAGVWYAYDQPKIKRNYDLFGKMAGVRRDNISHFPVKGFPDDASVVTKISFARWNVDGHTPSYLTLAELVALEDWGCENLLPDPEYLPRWYMTTAWECYLFGNDFRDFLERPHSGVEDVRLVFWFDN